MAREKARRGLLVNEEPNNDFTLTVFVSGTMHKTTNVILYLYAFYVNTSLYYVYFIGITKIKILRHYCYNQYFSNTCAKMKEGGQTGRGKTTFWTRE